MHKIIIGSDHAGFELKQAVKKEFEAKSYPMQDMGCDGPDSVDYPDFAQKVAQTVAADARSLGILICGTGIGMAIAANKVKGIRAAVCRNEYEAQMSRNHNNANILCLGARTLEGDVALRVVETFLRSDFEGDRHGRRVDKIMALEQS